MDPMSISPEQLSEACDPHADLPILTAGPRPEQAEGTIILLHGRGSTAEDILSLYAELELPNLAAQAPQAANRTWYPQSFLAPLEVNQPWLDSAIRRVATIVADLLSRGISGERIALLG